MQDWTRNAYFVVLVIRMQINFFQYVVMAGFDPGISDSKSGVLTTRPKSPNIHIASIYNTFDQVSAMLCLYGLRWLTQSV